jgi:hypothetical protein
MSANKINIKIKMEYEDNDTSMDEIIRIFTQFKNHISEKQRNDYIHDLYRRIYQHDVEKEEISEQEISN